MEILNSIGKRDWADYVHDYTLPKEGIDKKSTANTKDDAPEVNRTIRPTKD